MTLRHDAAKCREDAKSQRIRLELGILYPHEIQAQEDAENRRRLAQQKKAQQGSPLLGLEEE